MARRVRLRAGEEVVVELRRHGSSLATPLAFTAAVVVGAGAALWVGVSGAVATALLVVLAGSTLDLAVRYVSWRPTRLIVTTNRVVHRGGLLGRSELEIPLDAVGAVSVEQSLLGRAAGVGSLTIDGDGLSEPETISSLPRPAAVRDLIERLRRPGAGPPAPPRRLRRR